MIIMYDVFGNSDSINRLIDGLAQKYGLEVGRVSQSACYTSFAFDSALLSTSNLLSVCPTDLKITKTYRQYCHLKIFVKEAYASIFREVRSKDFSAYLEHEYDIDFAEATKLNDYEELEQYNVRLEHSGYVV